MRNCWTIAERAGDDNPGGTQDLIGRASWDDALVRADVRDFVARRLGHPDSILVVDETGDLRKGRHTVAVQRRYCGTAGKIENCRLAVRLTYASPLGHTLIDVARYLPRSWTDDPHRGTEAGVPEHVGFATKPRLGRRLIETAHARAACSAGGSPATRLVAATRTWPLRCAGIGSAMSWPSPARTGCRPGLGVQRADRSPPIRLPTPGSGYPPATARKATATTTGRSSPCPRLPTSTQATIGY